MKDKAVIILSGGLDSTTLLYDLVNQGYVVYAIGFDYGQKHKRELEQAEKTCGKIGIPFKTVKIEALNELSSSSLTTKEWGVPEGHYHLETMKQTVVPNRNMVMLSLAVCYAIEIGAKKVFYGAHTGDHTIYPDCRKEFVDAMKKAILLCDWNKIELEAPYLDFTKETILKRGIELGVDYSCTWTCYNGRSKACGKCGSCIERLEAFEKNKICDPLKYETIEV